jgi:folylpolyglutamate synthase/dihydropteroate synthase
MCDVARHGIIGPEQLLVDGANNPHGAAYAAGAIPSGANNAVGSVC